MELFLYMRNVFAFGAQLPVLCEEGNVFKSEDICSCLATWLITSEIFFPKIKIVLGLIFSQNSNRAWHFRRSVHHWVSQVWAQLWNPKLLSQGSKWKPEWEQKALWQVRSQDWTFLTHIFPFTAMWPCTWLVQADHVMCCKQHYSMQNSKTWDAS